MSETKKCPMCAEEIKAEAIKCKHCGASMNSADTTASNNDSPKINTKKLWQWTVIGMVAGYACGAFLSGLLNMNSGLFLGLIGAGVVGFLTHRSSKKNHGQAPTWLIKHKK